MNRTSIIALVLGAMLFGCGAGMLAHEAIESKAEAQNVWTGQKWDYFCEIYAGRAHPQLKELGLQGWELAAMNNGMYCLKRPLQ
jgi:hypothetical protein